MARPRHAPLLAPHTSAKHGVCICACKCLSVAPGRPCHASLAPRRRCVLYVSGFGMVLVLAVAVHERLEHTTGNG